MKIIKIYVCTKASGDNLNEVLRLALKKRISVVFMKESEEKYAIVPDSGKKILIYHTDEVHDNINLLIDEINRCLDNNLLISALNGALIIPGVLDNQKYSNLEYKGAYVKFYEENFVKKYRNVDKNDGMPYLSGKVLYKLKFYV